LIFNLTIQEVGKRLELRCPECTTLSGRIGLVKETSPRLKLYCKQHPENYGVWKSEEDMERDKLELAKRIGLA